MADFWSTIDDAFKTCAITQKCGQLCINGDGTEKVEESYLVLNFVPFQDKADTSKSNGAFQTHDTKDFQSHQQHQPQSSIASPSIKQPFHQEGGPSTGVQLQLGALTPSGHTDPLCARVLQACMHGNTRLVSVLSGCSE